MSRPSELAPRLVAGAQQTLEPFAVAATIRVMVLSQYPEATLGASEQHGRRIDEVIAHVEHITPRRRRVFRTGRRYALNAAEGALEDAARAGAFKLTQRVHREADGAQVVLDERPGVAGDDMLLCV